MTGMQSRVCRKEKISNFGEEKVSTSESYATVKQAYTGRMTVSFKFTRSGPVSQYVR